MCTIKHKAGEKDTEWEGKGEKDSTRSKERQRKGEHGVQHLFDCYLGATVSNYWLEPLKKLIRGSQRLRSGQKDLVPGTTQLSAGHLTTTYDITATSIAPQKDTTPPHASVKLLGSKWWILDVCILADVAKGGDSVNWLRSLQYLTGQTFNPADHTPQTSSCSSPSVSSFIVAGSQRRRTER